MTVSLTAVLLPVLMQIGPNPSTGAIPDYSAEVQDRPPRTRPVADPAGLVSSVRDSWLENCLELVETSPARAHVQAQLRRDEADPRDKVIANYCLGMAASALELWSDAETAFIAARDGSAANEPRLKARFGVMAGNAALAGGKTEAGLALLSAAQRDAEMTGFTPLAAIAAIDRALVLVQQGDEAGGTAALTDARRLDPESARAWLLSATMMRRMDRLDEAQSMIERAGELAATDPEVALEAGVIAVLSGRDDAAKASWDSVIALAPDSPLAETARGYLAQLAEPAPARP